MIIETPLTNHFASCLIKSKQRLLLASPFLSGFLRQLPFTANPQQDRRLLTRFSPENINTFNLPALQFLLDQGFTIRYNNEIHLKLYLFDETALIGSANLTSGGFEKNIELTVEAAQHLSECLQLFEDLWRSPTSQELRQADIDSGQAQYLVLAARDRAKGSAQPPARAPVPPSQTAETLFRQIFVEEIQHFEEIQDKVSAAEQQRQRRINELLGPHSPEAVYAPENHPRRRDCLFYDLQYGPEVQLAATGLVENQYRAVFEHQLFPAILGFLLPTSKGLPPWNLESPSELQAFAEGIFAFDLPQYKEVMPIRLASFFYPRHFLPIFSLKQLGEIAKSLGFPGPAPQEPQEQFLEYNSFLYNRTASVPVNNYVKSQMLYAYFFTNLLLTGHHNQKSLQDIKDEYRLQRAWIDDYLSSAERRLRSLNLI